MQLASCRLAGLIWWGQPVLTRIHLQARTRDAEGKEKKGVAKGNVVKMPLAVLSVGRGQAINETPAGAKLKVPFQRRYNEGPLPLPRVFHSG